MENYPVVIKNVLKYSLFLSVYDELLENWVLSNYSTPNDRKTENNLSWGQRYTHDKIVFYDASIVIKLKILKIIRENIKLIKIHVNGQTSLQKSNFHGDFEPDKVWTFVLFTEPNWDTQWGGEFVCQNPLTKEYHYVPYIPNSGVLIPSNWQHYGSSPNSFTENLRTTIAFSYSELNTIVELKKKEKKIKNNGSINNRSIDKFL